MSAHCSSPITQRAIDTCLNQPVIDVDILDALGALSPPQHQAPIQVVRQPCPICLDPVERHCATRLACDHTEHHFFHPECIRAWFRITPKCPVCRAQFPATEIQFLDMQPHTTCYSLSAARHMMDQIASKIELLLAQLTAHHSREARKQIQTTIMELQVMADSLSRSI